MRCVNVIYASVIKVQICWHDESIEKLPANKHDGALNVRQPFCPELNFGAVGLGFSVPKISISMIKRVVC
jgi:hypothetical protein